MAHAAPPLRAATGLDGSGTRVCALSDGVDQLAGVQASGDLPAVDILPGQAGAFGSEGTALLEIVHDLAPGAALGFATATGGRAAFAQNILDLRFNLGCDIIVDDVEYLAESPFQDGLIAQAAASVVEDGALYFASAGNSGNLRHATSSVWEGDFRAAAQPPGFPGATAATSVHDFGSRGYNALRTDPPFAITLFWSDPLGASANDYDLFLLNGSMTQVIASSTDIQDGSQDPYEFIDSRTRNDAGNVLVITSNGGEGRYLHLNALRGLLDTATSGQIKGHFGSNSVIAVAPVNVPASGPFTGSPADGIARYGSDGERRVFYRGDGSPYTPGNYSATGGVVRAKPDIAAADGVATATAGYNPFFGSSAAAAHAAGLAALALQHRPALRRMHLNALFSASSLDIEAPGRERNSGQGIPMADRLIDALQECLPVFADVPCNHPAYAAIAAIAQAGITRGCDLKRYCPAAAAAREQMAVTLLRGQYSGSYYPPHAAAPRFTDVPPASVYADWVEQLAVEGITVGCGGSLYCYGTATSRAQVALFLLRSRYGAAYQPPPASGNFFNDVPADYPAAAWIEQLAREGLTQGCGGSNYCPDADVTRAELALFLQRLYGL